MELFLVISVLWGGIGAIWILYLQSDINLRRQEFSNYISYHQKFISLYVEVSLRNRKLIQQNRNYKHAVADSLFYPKAYKLEDCVAWYQKYGIDQKDTEENESSVSEVAHFLKADYNEIRKSKAILS